MTGWTLNFRLALYLAVLLNEQYIGKYKLLCRNFSLEDKESSYGLIKDILQILKENKSVLKYEQSEAGSKLLQVANLNNMRFNTWLEENSVQLDWFDYFLLL